MKHHRIIPPPPSSASCPALAIFHHKQIQIVTAILLVDRVVVFDTVSREKTCDKSIWSEDMICVASNQETVHLREHLPWTSKTLLLRVWSCEKKQHKFTFNINI